MEHPEQKLFDEVKGLKTELEEVRDRIFKIENTYIDKVENIEKREYTSLIVEEKLKIYKENLESRKIFILDNHRIPLFKSTVERNIYNSEKLLNYWNNTNTEIVLDYDYDYFMAILEIVKRGHNFECLDAEDKLTFKRNFKLRTRTLSKDSIFNLMIKEFFSDHESFSKIVIDYNLNYSSVPNDLSDLVVSVKVLEGSGSMTHLDKHNILSKQDKWKKLTDVKNKLALFLDYNQNGVIELKTTVRINKIGLKPFTESSSEFSPTTGSYYPKLLVSNNEKHWDEIGVMPSDYGSFSNDYISSFNFGSYKSVKYIKITTNSSSQFSLSYIKFE